MFIDSQGKKRPLQPNDQMVWDRSSQNVWFKEEGVNILQVDGGGDYSSYKLHAGFLRCGGDFSDLAKFVALVTGLKPDSRVNQPKNCCCCRFVAR